jgi:hypothetical protein
LIAAWAPDKVYRRILSRMRARAVGSTALSSEILMKLRVRFLQLPILFDAGLLAQEVAAIPESAWRPHPKKFPGNDALALITTDGDPLSDARAGVMAPTPHLLECPYLMEVLGTLGATWGRTRLMRLSGNAEVTPHVDTDYYWRDHMRVHVPIITQPTVRFLCGDEQVHMAAGECWTFDTWSLHSVHNDAIRSRIHLVADTVGGEGFLDLMEKGRSPRDDRSDWAPRFAAPGPKPTTGLAYETRNIPEVMTPWELRDHLGFLLSDVGPGHPRMPAIAQTLNRLRMAWHALWARAGDDEAARPEYAALLSTTWRRLESLDVNNVPLRNQMALGLCLKALIFDVALSGGSAAMDGDDRMGPGGVAPSSANSSNPPAEPRRVEAPVQRSSTALAKGDGPQFDRPIFIVSPPRSGSTLLFETLSAAPSLMTIGGESHQLMETIASINPAIRGWTSNRMTAADATPETVALLRDRFYAALRDRNGQKPAAGPVRMLEKTPKNALRIPLIAAAFPEARFIYLYRDPRPTLASMIEAWRSGRFKTYPQLPDWVGLPWSLLLIPGWRDLIGAPLNQIVAQQWATTTKIMLDDLSVLPRDRWASIRYDAFVAAPQDEVLRVCRNIDIGWDRQLAGHLPIARHTVSAPDAKKWRAHEGAIESVLPLWGAENARALAILQ